MAAGSGFGDFLGLGFDRGCVSLISIWNYAGRVTSGFASEYFLERFKLPRPLMLTKYTKITK